MAEHPFSQSSTVIDHLSRGYERLTQLLALISSSPANPSTTAPAMVLVDKAMCCIAAALSELQTSSPRSVDSPTAAEDHRNGTDSKKRCKKNVQSWTIVTSVPHFDGHQWRKYGQKRIHSSEFPRSYYKCTHSKDQGCKATKTIQQKEDKISNNPPKYVVSYSVHHTCKAIETHEIPIVMDSLAITNEHSTSSSQAASPDLSSPVLPKPVADIEQVSPIMDYTEPDHGEANWFEGSGLLSPFADSDIDWERLMS
ncbi:probable WRKY transcription factor 3 isoform X2 [Dendrobium catenatum]|uniref:Putative WRKY transcription factor 70 n=1 Tax=Dendrobium catenatum TaxID=906689 RepID=A0A2I0WQZ7_9ASPA|nr:probable WRKY transcription factor 3 isoform X2 [Dendrobium catenatum]PKU78083.1 putative WRKY transcription factor 70 [Dendrobium catenatum]